MSKNDKPKAVKGRNDNRPNGKSWKKAWGTDGPPKAVVDLAATQSALSKRNKKAKAS